MAVLQRVAFYPQQRLDTPDARALEAFSQNDWNYFLRGVVSTKSMVISGFDVSNYANIFTVPGVKLKISNTSLIHPEAKTAASGFYVAAGNEKDITLTLNPASTNFVEMDLKSSPSVRDVRAFWDMGADGGKGSEYTDNIDTVINLEIDVTANVAGFSEGKIPLYKIVTNAQGLVLELTDCRPMMYRLATGGSSPDPLANAEFPAIPDASHAEFENNPTATEATATNAPFLGGDKNIKSLKQWMDIIMTRMKQMNSTSYWYQRPQSTLAGIYQNAALTILSGGSWEHLTGAAGRLKLTDGSTVIRFGQENSILQPFASIDLTVNKTLYILLSNDGSAVTYGYGGDTSTPVIPRDITAVTNTTVTVEPDGNYVLVDGKLFIKGAEFSYDSYNDTTGLFLGVYPDPSALAEVGDIAYQASNAGVGYYMTSTTDRLPNVTADGISLGVERVYWLAYFDSVETIIIKDSELIPGESVQVGDDTPDQVYEYIGSTSGADNYPVYDVNSIPNGMNLTDAISEAFKLLETPIYDEIIPDTDSSGWEANEIVYLPNNTKTNTSATYTMGTDELQVYRDGNLLRKTYDYDELSSNSIRLLRPIYVDSYLRFRISSVGGAGSASGAVSAISLQSAYDNGKTITSIPNEPVVFNGSTPTQEVLSIDGKITVTSLVKSGGVEIVDVETNPIPAGKTGLWVDQATKKLFFTNPDGSFLAVSGGIEHITGDNANLKRSMQNTTGATIPVNSAVYISGTRQIALADADDPIKHRIFGFTAASVGNNDWVDVIYQGVVPNLLAGSGIASGSWVWLQAVPGTISDTDAGITGAYLVIVGQADGDDLIIQIQTNGQIG